MADRCTGQPIVAKSKQTFCRMANLDGLGRNELVKFEREAVTTWRCESVVSLWHGDNPPRKIKENGAWGGGYGHFLSGIKDAVEDAEKTCAFLQVGAQSSLYLTVTATIRDETLLLPRDKYSVCKNAEHAEKGWLARVYDPIPNDWR